MCSYIKTKVSKLHGEQQYFGLHFHGLRCPTIGLVGEILRGLFRFPFRASFCAFVTCPMIIALMLALAVRLAAEALKGNCLLAPRISSN